MPTYYVPLPPRRSVLDAIPDLHRATVEMYLNDLSPFEMVDDPVFEMYIPDDPTDTFVRTRLLVPLELDASRSVRIQTTAFDPAEIGG